MATSPLTQIPDSSIDAAGLSVTTSIQSPTDPRPGHVYDPVNLAAAVPIHFHPMTSPSMGGTNFLMLNSQIWTSATPSTADPGAFSAFTPNTNPSWVIVNAATGTKTVLNSGWEIPMVTPNDARVLTSAVSRGNDFLWTLNKVTQGSDTVAVVQHWHNNPVLNTVIPLSEEIIPTATNGSDTVVYSAGLQLTTSNMYMYVYGTDSSNQVYAARKRWARVGHTGTATDPLDTQWEFYHGASGAWSTDPTSVAPVQTASGALISTGPVSFAYTGIQRNQKGMNAGLTGYAFMATVQGSTTKTAQIYSSLAGRPWTPMGAPVALGTSGSTYLGATLQFQGLVGPNPAMVNAATASTAIPYLTSVLATSGGDSSIVNTWGILQVPRLS